ncbi:MAG: hypothetical protein ABTQ93_01515 [Candidatus Competibacter denitrificans]
MDPTFKLTALGIQPQQDSQVVRRKLANFFQGGSREIDALIQRILTDEYVVLAENLPLNTGQNLLRMLTDSGLKCRLEPMRLTLAPLEKDTTHHQCPACGHRQAVATDGTDICERCGVVGHSYQAYTEKKEAFERERLQGLLTSKNRVRTEALKGRISKQQQKAEMELLTRALRQAEKNMGISPWIKLKAALKFRTLGSALVAIGMGFLAWQHWGIDQSTRPKAATKPLFEISASSISDAVLKMEPVAPQEKQRTDTGSVSTSPATNVASGPAAGAAKPAAPLPVPTPSGRSELSPVSAPSSTIAVSPINDTGFGSKSAARVGTRTQPETGTAGALSTPQMGAVSTVESLPDAGHSAGRMDSATNSSLLIEPDKLAPSEPQSPSTASMGPTTVTPAATVTATPIPVTPDNARLMVEWVRYQTEIGDTTTGLATLGRVTELLEEQPSRFSAEQLDSINHARVVAMGTIAMERYKEKAMTVAQDQWLQAARITNIIGSASERSLAYASLARSLNTSNASNAGDYFKRAGENARTITDPATRAVTLSALGRDLAATGRTDQAGEVFAQVKNIVADLSSQPSHLVALSAVAQHLAEAGATVAAKNLLQQLAGLKLQVPSPAMLQHRLQAQSALAHNLAVNGDADTARSEFTAVLSAAMAIKDQATRDATLLYLARMLVRAGDLTSADRIVADVLQKRIPPSSAR